MNGIIFLLCAFMFFSAYTPCAKYDSHLYPCIHLCCQAVITSFVPFTHHSCFSPVLCVCVCVCFFSPPSAFSCRLSLCQYLLRGSELGGECRQGWSTMHCDTGALTNSVFFSALTPLSSFPKMCLFLPHPVDLWSCSLPALSVPSLIPHPVLCFTFPSVLILCLKAIFPVSL